MDLEQLGLYIYLQFNLTRLCNLRIGFEKIK